MFLRLKIYPGKELLCLLALFVFFVESSSQESLCDVRIMLSSDTITYTDDEVCLALSVNGFVEVSSFALSISYPNDEISFMDTEDELLVLDNMAVTEDTHESQNIIIIEWQQNLSGMN